jgi:sulfatase modifying factor 1
MRLPRIQARLALLCLAASGCRTVLGIGDPHEVAEAGGDSGAPGTPGVDASGDAGGGPPSCIGLPSRCGDTHDRSCCDTIPVPGGNFNRHNDPALPATISDFSLDRYEITVGRIRRFAAAFAAGSRPRPGDGAHPRIPGSGWQSEWDGYLGLDQEALVGMLNCPDSLWGVAPDDERRPATCLTYYVAFAFCAWDGGRLPTRAEWSYAAAGGNQQRPYPWTAPGDAEIVDQAHANFDRPCAGCSAQDLLEVGSRPLGNGFWGHADLSGNAWEWNLDGTGPPPSSCHDCAVLGGGSTYVIAGGSVIDPAPSISVKDGFNRAEAMRLWFLQGARCARDR